MVELKFSSLRSRRDYPRFQRGSTKMASPGESASAQMVERVLVPRSRRDYPRFLRGSTKMASPGESANAQVVEPRSVPPQP